MVAPGPPAAARMIQAALRWRRALSDNSHLASGERALLVSKSAIAGRRSEVFLVSKVLPDHAGRREAIAALAWVLQRDGVIAIPKAGTLAHARENCAALDIRLTANELTAFERALPAPTGPIPLETL